MEAQGKTVVTYESEATVNSWLPTGLGTSIIGAHIREQLTHMRAEMLRRRLSTKAGLSPLLAPIVLHV